MDTTSEPAEAATAWSGKSSVFDDAEDAEDFGEELRARLEAIDLRLQLLSQQMITVLCSTSKPDSHPPAMEGKGFLGAFEIPAGDLPSLLVPAPRPQRRGALRAGALPSGGGITDAEASPTPPQRVFMGHPFQAQTETFDGFEVNNYNEGILRSLEAIQDSQSMRRNSQHSMRSESSRRSEPGRRDCDFGKMDSYDQMDILAANEVKQSYSLSKMFSDPGKETTVAGRLCARFLQLRSKAQDGEKPFSYQLVHNSVFEVVSCLVIVINAGYVGFSGTMQLRSLAFGHPRLLWDDYVQISFCIFFTCELLVKLVAERPLFFFLGEHYLWNTLDCLIVTSSVTDVLINGLNSSGVAVTIGRLLRLARFTRIFRLTRVIRHCSSLRLLVFSFINSLGYLFWCFMAMGFVLYMYAVLLLFGLTEHFQTTGTDTDLSVLKDSYGRGVYDIMLSLFMAICGGFDWQEAFNHWKQVGEVYGLIFLSYIFVMIFGVLNVVVANFVKVTMDAASRDKETFVNDQAFILEDYAEKVRHFFKEADADKSGTLSWDEFRQHMKNPDVQAYFSALELDISQAHKLFQLLDADGDKGVSLEEFVSGTMRLRGSASNVDLNVILMHTKQLTSQMASLRVRNDQQLRILREMRRGAAAR